MGDDYKVLNSTKVYAGHIMEVYNDKLSMPEGVVGYREYVVRHGDASAIVPVNSDGDLIFVRQYRHPVRREVLEIPAGMLEAGEDPKESAFRELEEETGFKTDKLEKLLEMHSAVGILNEKIYIYLAENLLPGKQHFDRDEFIEVETHSLEQAVAMIFSGEITDSKTIAGVLAYQEIVNKRK